MSTLQEWMGSDNEEGSEKDNGEDEGTGDHSQFEEGVSGTGSSSELSEGSEEESDDDDDDDEPVLKYRRFAKEVIASISDPTKVLNAHISCIAVHSKFIALGMTEGTIKLLDHTGAILMDRVYTLHSDVINQISVDEDGEYVASCSNDKKVIIMGLFSTKYNNVTHFDKPIKSVALHPHFSKSTNHIIVVGYERLVMIEERRWPLGSKSIDIHGGGGIITTIKWTKNLIAWANQKAVLVYDTSLREIITSISYEEEIIKDVPCSLFWQSPEVLLVGRGHLVKTVTLREGDLTVPMIGDMDAVGTRRRKFMAITAQNTFEFLVCGVVPISVNEEWKLVVLCYSGHINEEDSVEKGQVPPPHVVVVSPGQYMPAELRFDVPKNDACDKLLPRGYQFCRCEEYKLGCILDEGRLYILTPVDIILAEKRNPEDRVEWLLEKEDFEGAMKYVENPEIARQIFPGRLKEIGIKYIYYLIENKDFQEAARKCPDVIGTQEADSKRWEDIIYSFYQAGQLNEIRPFIPLSNPRLSPAFYELILNHFLQENYEMLYRLIKEWPTSIYSTQTIINAVEMKLKDDPKNSDLLKVKAHLHEDMGQYDAALKIYLHQGYKEVFELIHERKLYSALLENLVPLLEVGTEEAVKLLNDCKEDVPPKRVVSELESLGREEYLHKYLDCMFERNPKSGGEFHERQVELYAKYEPDKLLIFLRSCNDIPLQKALEVCEKYDRGEETVYLLARMGNPKAALRTIINRLQDVDKAIEFAMEEDDAELWEVLINLSIHQPRFITGLLNNVGTHIDPTRLIKKIPERTEIPDLGASLVKLMHDFRIQVNLREGCKKILVKDSHVLMEKLVKLQKRAVFIDDDSICRTCGAEVVGIDEKADYVVFFCSHIYHQRCVSKKNDMMLCRLCYAGASSSAKRLGQRPRFMS